MADIKGKKGNTVGGVGETEEVNAGMTVVMIHVCKHHHAVRYFIQ